MKFILLLGCCLLALAANAQYSEGIEYSENGVFNWDMFKGKVNPRHITQMGTSTGAVTVSAISYKTLSMVGKTVRLQVSALFIPDASWTKYPHLNDPKGALIHEKRHFDICEIYARKLRKQISLTHFNFHTFSNDLNNLFKKFVADYKVMQDRYDQETQHSLDAHQQALWNARIDNELKALAQYSANQLSVPLN